MRFTRYKDVKYSIDTHTRKILIAHFTDKTVDEIKFFHRIIFSQKYDDVVFSFKLITKISKIQIAAVGKYFIKKYFLEEELILG